MSDETKIPEEMEAQVPAGDHECQCEHGSCADCPHQHEDPAPEVSDAPPEDPNVLGVLEPSEMGILMAIQQQGRAVVQRVGEIEVEKFRLMGQLSSLEGQNQQHLQSIAKRLGIPQGTQWQVTQDGKIRKAPSPGTPPNLRMVPQTPPA